MSSTGMLRRAAFLRHFVGTRFADETRTLERRVELERSIKRTTQIRTLAHWH